MEELLNKLIEKGWKPMGYEAKFVKQQKNGKIHIYSSHGYYSGYRETLRTLTSKESGLWQFVCENGMIKKIKEENYVKNYKEYGDGECGFFTSRYDDNYQYRLIESALKDESELEEFLLNNIEIGK